MNPRRNFVSIPATREPLSLLSVERALAELRRGDGVALRGGQGTASLIMAAEAATVETLDRFSAMVGGPVQVAITARRARVLGLIPDTLKVVTVALGERITTDVVHALTDPLFEGTMPDLNDMTVEETDAFSNASAAVCLTKIARLLPAVVIAPVDEDAASDLDAWASRHRLLVVDAGDAFQYEHTAVRTLRPVSEARVPLVGAEQARIIAFRPRDGGLEHLAIIIGEPDLSVPVLTRLHSECFTGDILASLRCDCGDQLRGAIRAIDQAGGGVLLYLAQEGRGIGLVNKLRAYELQDRGFDTLDANEQLGFDADERVYLPAVRMLRQLGIDRVRLLTNNPTKVEGLSRRGISVIERVAHAFPTNPHNEPYMRTKQGRGGHLF